MNIIETIKPKLEKDNIIKNIINFRKKSKGNNNTIKYLIIILFLFFLSLIVLFTIIFFSYNLNEKNYLLDNGNFKINSEVKSLSQIIMESKQYYYSKKDNMNYKSFFYSKTKYDVYTLNDSLFVGENNMYYKKYCTIIIMNFQCLGFKENKTDCELFKYLDLTIKNQNNLKNNHENIEEIKEAILPICIIEHSDTNIILSIICPKTLSNNLKNNIILAFKNIKPNLSKIKIKNGDDANIKINNKKGKLFINIIDKSENNQNQKYEIIRNIITDKNGNLEIINKTTKYEIFEKDKIEYEIFVGNSFENMSIKKKNSIEEIFFRQNLNIILDLINPLMEKQKYSELNLSNNYFTNEFSFKRIFDNDDFDFPDVKEEKFLYDKIKEKFLYDKINGIDITLNLK